MIRGAVEPLRSADRDEICERSTDLTSRFERSHPVLLARRFDRVELEQPALDQLEVRARVLVAPVRQQALDEHRLVEGVQPAIAQRYEVPEWVAYGFDGASFPEGGYTIVAYAEDIAGNVSESAPVSFGVGAVEAPTSGGDDSDGNNSGGTGGFDVDDGSDDKGCSCDVGTSAPPHALAAFLVLLAAGRRRRPTRR